LEANVMTEQRGGEPLGDAFQRLGENLQKMVQHAWASDTRRQLQRELETGLGQLERSVRDLAAQVAESEPGRKVQRHVEDIQSKVETGELEDKARQELVRALARINSELETTLERWQQSSGSDQDPTARAE
jgi:hypothetical protein